MSFLCPHLCSSGNKDIYTHPHTCLPGKQYGNIVLNGIASLALESLSFCSNQPRKQVVEGMGTILNKRWIKQSGMFMGKKGRWDI